MFEDFFIRGTLEMSRSPETVRASASVLWGDILANRIMICVCVAVFLLALPAILSILPSVLDCIFRVRAVESLEHSVSLSRTRNLAAVCLVPPFCLTVNRYGIYHPSFLDGMAQGAVLATTFGAIAAFVLIRLLLSLALRSRNLKKDTYDASCHALYDIFIPACLLSVACALAFHAAGLREEVAQSILTGEIIFFWALALIRSAQILGSRCDFFTTILYLCALEILPSALLVASAIYI